MTQLGETIQESECKIHRSYPVSNASCGARVFEIFAIMNWKSMCYIMPFWKNAQDTYVFHAGRMLTLMSGILAE